MTTTSAVSGTSTAAAAAAATSTSTTDADKKTATLDYNSFLQLLVAQMKNQDPLNPTDATAQLSQLASFSNVEQSIKQNQKLESLVANANVTQANLLIGRTITGTDGKTSGVVKSVSITDSGVTATTTNGTQIPVGIGISIQ